MSDGVDVIEVEGGVGGGNLGRIRNFKAKGCL